MVQRQEVRQEVVQPQVGPLMELGAVLEQEIVAPMPLVEMISLFVEAVMSA